MDPRAPERLDRVDVSEARDRPLIEEQRLDRSTRAFSQKRPQPRDGEPSRERLLPERRVERRLRAARLAIRRKRRGVDERHPPELAGVRKAKRRAVRESDLGAHVALIDVLDAIKGLPG